MLGFEKIGVGKSPQDSLSSEAKNPPRALKPSNPFRKTPRPQPVLRRRISYFPAEGPELKAWYVSLLVKSLAAVDSALGV